MTDRITATAPYGQHITLNCMNHPKLFWSTKNIGNQSKSGIIFTARSVFYLTDHLPECECSSSHLRVVHDYQFEGIGYTSFINGDDIHITRKCDGESWVQPTIDLPAPLLTQLREAGVFVRA